MTAAITPETPVQDRKTRQRAQARAANRAWTRATKELIRRHGAEWDELYRIEAAKEGVQPKGRRTNKKEQAA
jgi:hypothetical protein